MGTRIASVMVAAVLLMMAGAWALEPGPYMQLARTTTARNISHGIVSVAVDAPQMLIRGADKPFEVTVTSDRDITFRYGKDVREVLGVYVLGPWGPVKPKSEHWMLGESRCADAQPVTIAKDKPWKVQFKLSDLFELPDGHGTNLEQGQYQVNVKFFVRGQDLDRPVDAAPVYLTVQPLAQFRHATETEGPITRY